MGSGEGFRRAGVRVYKFEEEKNPPGQRKKVSISGLKGAGTVRQNRSQCLGAAMIRMHCFSVTRLGALLLQGWWSGHAGPLFHRCGVAGWLGKKALQKRDVPCMEIS